MNGSQTDQAGYEWIDQLKIPEKFAATDYEYGADRRALNAFRAVPGSGWLVKKFVNISIPFQVADLLGNAVQVSARQFPEIHRLVVRISQILGIDPPPTYLLESPELNAYTFGPDEKTATIVVQRGLLQAARPRELAFILGHEMGHIKSQHVVYHTLGDWIEGTGLFLAGIQIPIVSQVLGVLSLPAQYALLAWQRRSEITADRAGLIACQDLLTARTALALLALGSRDLADRVDTNEIEGQRSKNYGKWQEISRAHLSVISLFNGVLSRKIEGRGAFPVSVSRPGVEGRETGNRKTLGAAIRPRCSRRRI